MAVAVGTYWGFWGDSQTDGRAPSGTCESSPDAIENSWDGATPTVYSDGNGGETLDQHSDNYDAYASKSSLTWVHYQESGGQIFPQETATKFGDEFEAAMKNIAADSTSAVISYETAFSFGRESESGRDWGPYNTEMLSRVEDLETNDSITVIVADVDKYIKLLQVEKTPGDVWYQSDETNPYHYTALGNFMVALTVWDALGYDVSTMDLSGVTDVSTTDKNICIDLFDVAAEVPEVIYLLAEDGQTLLFEDGSEMLTEDSALEEDTGFLLAEDGQTLLFEDGSEMLNEGASDSILPIKITGTVNFSGTITRKRDYKRNIGGSI